MKHKFIVFIAACLFIGLGYWSYLVKPWISEHTIETTTSSFSIKAWEVDPVYMKGGFYYVCLDITPAPYPPASFDIYRYAKYAKYGKVVHIVLTDQNPNYRFSIIDFKDDYMLVRFKTKDEVKEFMEIFNYPNYKIIKK